MGPERKILKFYCGQECEEVVPGSDCVREPKSVKMISEDELRERVKASLSNARDNGYHMASSYTRDEIEKICADMLDMDADLEGQEIEAIRPLVEAHFRRTGQYRGGE